MRKKVNLNYMSVFVDPSISCTNVRDARVPRKW